MLPLSFGKLASRTPEASLGELKRKQTCALQIGKSATYQNFS